MPTTPKQIALDLTTRINAGDIAGAAALLAEDLVNHAAVPEAQGRAGFVTIITKLRTAFPDLQHAVEDVLVDGDKVVLRTTVTGTQDGPFAMTHAAFPATGKSVRFEQIHILRIARGVVVEEWMTLDAIAMLRQLGLKIGAPASA
jgi:predicted ester cyclase